MSLVSAGDLMRSLKILEGKITWIRCPMCADEVSKLKPCRYWVRNSELTSNVCVECGEAAGNLIYFPQKYPITGVDVVTELMPVYKSLDKKWVNSRSYKAHVTYGDMGFLVWQEGPRLCVLEDKKTPDQKKTYDNNYQVWFSLKKIFEDGPKEELLAGKFKKGGYSKW